MVGKWIVLFSVHVVDSVDDVWSRTTPVAVVLSMFGCAVVVSFTFGEFWSSVWVVINGMANLLVALCENKCVRMYHIRCHHIVAIHWHANHRK